MWLLIWCRETQVCRSPERHPLSSILTLSLTSLFILTRNEDSEWAFALFLSKVRIFDISNDMCAWIDEAVYNSSLIVVPGRLHPKFYARLWKARLRH